MSWQRVTSEELEKRTGVVVEVEVDGSVNVRSDWGTWQLRPDHVAASGQSDDLTVRLDMSRGRLAVLPAGTNTVVLRMERDS